MFSTKNSYLCTCNCKITTFFLFMQRFGAYKWIFFLLLFFFPVVLRANPHTRVRFGVLGGGLLQTEYTNKFKIDRPVLGGEVAVEFMPDYVHPWGTHLNGSSWGVAAAVYNFGNDQKLGSAVAVYPFVDFHLVYRPHFLFSIRPGVGLSFNTKRYSNTISDDLRWKSLYNGPDKSDPANQAIGSMFNAYLTAQLVFEFPIRNGWSIEASGGWNHMSNGSITAPNGGLNMVTGQLAAKYFPHHTAYRQPNNRDNQLTWREKTWGMEIVGAGGLRQLYYQDRKFYGIASLSVAGFYRPCQIFRIGLGADAFYDGVYSAVNVGSPDEIKTNYHKTYTTKENSTKNCFRVGVSLMPELVLGRLTAGFGFGIYLWDPHKNWESYADVVENGGEPLKRGIFYKYSDTANKQDGWFYTRAQLRYHITDHFLVSVALKTHLQKAECIEWGIGYAL